MNQAIPIKLLFPEAICPLCSQVYLREQLRSHIARERERVREQTIQVIQAYHKDWAAEHGACEPCWKSFREAARVLSLLRQTKRQRPDYEWQRAKPRCEDQDLMEVRERNLS